MMRLDTNWYVGGGDKVALHISEALKWEAEDYKEVRYSGVEAFEVVSGDKASQIEAETDGSCIDEYHEYLVIHFADGDTATFRNSHTALFVC